MADTRFLASNLTHLCQQKGVSVSAVAKALEVSPTALLKLSRGESNARFGTLLKLGEYFHIDHLALGAVDLSAPGALEAASLSGAEAETPHTVSADEAVATKPVVEPPVVRQRKVPVLSCMQAAKLTDAGSRDAAATDWLPPLPGRLFSDTSLFAVKAPSATMHPSIRQGDYLYLRRALNDDLDPLATVLAEVGTDDSLVFSLGTVVAKSSAELLLVGINPVTGTEPRLVRQVVGVVVAVLSIR